MFIFRNIKTINLTKRSSCLKSYTGWSTTRNKNIKYSTSSSGKINQNSNATGSNYKYFAALAIGGITALLVADKLGLTDKLFSRKTKPSSEGGPLLKLDLNEIYESSAVLFLSSKDFRETLGIPIKVTSSETDEVRTLNLRREGDQLYSFISYNVEGSLNSGVVYCKLHMHSDTQKFETISMFLKLNKPDKKNRTEIPLKLPDKKSHAKVKLKLEKNEEIKKKN